MRGNPMSSRRSIASILLVFSLAVGFTSVASMVNAESLKPVKSVRDKLGTKKKHRFRGVRIHLPIGPTSVYHDYPYYYSRGYYPTHVGGYAYYPYYFYRHPYYHYRERVRRH
jgi:hypothetical protein